MWIWNHWPFSFEKCHSYRRKASGSAGYAPDGTSYSRPATQMDWSLNSNLSFTFFFLYFSLGWLIFMFCSKESHIVIERDASHAFAESLYQSHTSNFVTESFYIEIIELLSVGKDTKLIKSSFIRKHDWSEQANKGLWRERGLKDPVAKSGVPCFTGPRKLKLRLRFVFLCFFSLIC